MRKIAIILLALCTFSAAQAQGNFEVGGAIGFPTADASNFSDFMIAIDAYYFSF